MRRSLRWWVRPLLCAVVSVGVGSAVLVSGRSSLSPPNGWTASHFVRWAPAAGWLIAVFAIARLMVLAASLLLAVGSLVVVVAASAQAPGWRSGCLRRLVRLPGGRLVARVALGFGASGLVAGACGTAGPITGPARTVVPATSRISSPAATEAAPVLRNLSAPPGKIPATSSPTAVPAGAGTAAPFSGHSAGGGSASRAIGTAPTARATPPVAGATAAAATAERAAPAGSDGSAPQPGTASRAFGQWLVRPGDSLWSIAEATAATPGTVSAYWVRLVALNRSRLPVPGDPSLLYPGETVLLPLLHADPP